MAFSQESEVSEDNDDRDKDEDIMDEGFQSEKDDEKDSDEQSHRVRHTGPEPDLDDILQDDCKVPMPKPTGIIPWLEDVYKSSRGFELGTFDASILPVIWKKQSANWDELALGYVSDIVSIVHLYTSALITAICEDQCVQSALMSTLMDGLIERYTKSIDHTKFIIYVEKDGTPQTLNHYFADNLEKW